MPGLRIRSIFSGSCKSEFQTGSRIRIPDPDPGSYWHLKNQFKHQNFFHIKHISSDIWMMIIFIGKNGNIHLKLCKKLFLKYFFLVYTTLHCQSTDRIRIRWKFSGSGSGSYQKGPDSDPDPQPWVADSNPVLLCRSSRSKQILFLFIFSATSPRCLVLKFP